MRTVLHIGMPKTGTTALQDCLSKSREYLRACSVLYPENTGEVSFNNHRLLVQPILRFQNLPPSMRRNAEPSDLERWHSRFIATVREQMESARPSCLLLSSEHVFRAVAHDDADRLRDELRAIGVGEVDVSVYVRRPSEAFLSLAQQRLKVSHRINRPMMPGYRKTLQRCLERFGRKHLFVRLFDRTMMVGGDIVSDFCASFLTNEGVERSRLEEPSRSNASISAESMCILQRYRMDLEHGMNGQFSVNASRLFVALRNAETFVGATPPKLYPEIADMIDYSSDQPNWLRDTFGVEFPDYDYARHEKKGLTSVPRRDFAIDELVHVNPAIIGALLHELAGTWAKRDPRKAAWVAGMQRDLV